MEQIKEYEYIDLGLPSGLKWAKCNVGADKETDYGYYFQWGEIEPHDADTPYNWVNYKYCKGSSTTLTKYNIMGEYGTVDNKLTLDLEDDAARANMGGDWRMPTQSDFLEMLDYTDSEWVENFNGSGVNGRKFTSKINGNIIIKETSNTNVLNIEIIDEIKPLLSAVKNADKKMENPQTKKPNENMWNAFVVIFNNSTSFPTYAFANSIPNVSDNINIIKEQTEMIINDFFNMLFNSFLLFAP